MRGAQGDAAGVTEPVHPRARDPQRGSGLALAPGGEERVGGGELRPRTKPDRASRRPPPCRFREQISRTIELSGALLRYPPREQRTAEAWRVVGDGEAVAKTA